jgi:hypothetical protein
MAQEIYLTARCRAFAGSPAREHKIMVDSAGVVRVYDSVAGYYTTCHSLSARTQRRIRSLATSTI